MTDVPDRAVCARSLTPLTEADLSRAEHCLGVCVQGIAKCTMLLRTGVVQPACSTEEQKHHTNIHSQSTGGTYAAGNIGHHQECAALEVGN